MSIIASKSWLPPELTAVQPYSMGPLMCVKPRCGAVLATPAAGTCVGMDRPELMISAAFVAPPAVQRGARSPGRRDIVMMIPRGLPELLDDPKLWPRTKVKVPWALNQVSPDDAEDVAAAGEALARIEAGEPTVSLADLLASLDADEED